MRKIRCVQIVFSATLAVSACLPVFAGSLSVYLNGFPNNTGQARCGLFDSDKTWRKESLALKTVVVPIENRQAVCQFGEIEPGVYAVAVFQAEQGEDKVRYGFLGKPEQTVGFSNNPSIMFGAPDYEESAFHVDEQPLELMIDMKS